MILDNSQLEIFASKVDKRGHDECWEWLGGKYQTGYGKFSMGKRNSCEYVHRISWQLFNGPISEGKMILHKCNNRGCVNPYHLYAGDGFDNARDMIRSGRGPNRCKLIRSDIDSIRRLIELGEQQQRIAEEFQVSEATISKVKNNLNFPAKDEHFNNLK